MNEDRRTLRISYGDKHYQVEISSQIEIQREWRQQLEHLIISHVYGALVRFHCDNNGVQGDVAKLKMKLHNLAYDRPDLEQELLQRELIW